MTTGLVADDVWALDPPPPPRYGTDVPFWMDPDPMATLIGPDAYTGEYAHTYFKPLAPSLDGTTGST